jgi:hypothetical protein
MENGEWGMGSRIIVVHKNFILGAIGEWGNGSFISMGNGHLKNNQLFSKNPLLKSMFYSLFPIPYSPFPKKLYIK